MFFVRVGHPKTVAFSFPNQLQTLVRVRKTITLR